MQRPLVLELTGQNQQYQYGKGHHTQMNSLILEQPTASSQDKHDLGSVAKTKLSLK